MGQVELQAPTSPINGTISLSGSKSLSNRALIIQALSEQDFDISNLASAKDTQILKKLLNQTEGEFDAGHAGTTFRFMTSYLAFQNGSQILTGSERMKLRPIGSLVEALNEIGANIEYLDQEGFPPLKVHSPKQEIENEISLKADVSSQFISSLALIAPTLEHGLTIRMEGDVVSKSYIQMTLGMMEYFGVSSDWKENSIHISHQKYFGKPITIEGDWSSASYLYGIVALSEGSSIQIKNLFDDSLQGDSAIQEIMSNLGVKTCFEDDGIKISSEKTTLEKFEYDFILQPDLVQTISVVNAIKGIPSYFTGTRTLQIKETERVTALQRELSKTGISIESIKENSFQQKSKAQFEEKLSFETYDDHRMAMALSLLSFISPTIINDPKVVVKSYPSFWNDLEQLGFVVTSLS